MNRGTAVIGSLVLVSLLGFACVSLNAQTNSSPVIAKPGAFKWAALMPGVEMTVLFGDPSKPGPYTLRLRMPDGTKIAPHWHPEDENVTVMRGEFMAGMGDKFDATSLQDLPQGSYVMMPKAMHHFAQAKGETVVQLHGNGPFVLNYVNPADDPAKAK
jgi:anti-sigma factor ChrR (cupin superfamily)